LLPKVSTPHDLHAVENELAGVCDSSLALWAMVETPLAILNIAALADAGGPACLSGDGHQRPDQGNAWGSYPETSSILRRRWACRCCAARAHGLASSDGVYNDIANSEGFAASCARGTQLRLRRQDPDPSQPDRALQRPPFSPTPDEVEAAKKIVAAFESPENKGKGAIKLDGRLVELLHAESAKRTLAAGPSDWCDGSALTAAVARAYTKSKTRPILPRQIAGSRMFWKSLHHDRVPSSRASCFYRFLAGDLRRAQALRRPESRAYRRRTARPRRQPRSLSPHAQHRRGTGLKRSVKSKVPDERTAVPVKRYLFEGERFAERARGGTRRAEKVRALARSFYMELPAALTARKRRRETGERRLRHRQL